LLGERDTAKALLRAARVLAPSDLKDTELKTQLDSLEKRLAP
jgi:hypothetical protein